MSPVGEPCSRRSRSRCCRPRQIRLVAQKAMIGTMITANRRNQEIDYFVQLSRSPEPAERVLAYAVLAQRLGAVNVQESVRARVEPVIDAALTRTHSAEELARAVTLMRLESSFGDRLRAAGVLSSGSDP